ncbi:hypothetical protein OEZ60_17585 [Defluviimonas sp. WL0024]|uniref:DUF4142 domain-containing protein n=1 Tax=Albidovulum salinarum TaxID=2984153 RepID=A0ABT2X785_9RHOB|nr:hypothetical protein [Defluviimonas sp. WL0024]MCU9849813.1 hypothetical protein [Defluviimonas sp. WL0024]
MAALTGLCLALSGLSANAQETAKELAAKASDELRLLTSLQVLERMTSQVNHFLVYSIEAERGGWRVMEKEIGNDYAIRSNADRAAAEVATAYNSVKKSKFATEDELKGAEAAFENVNVLIALAPQIADLILAKDFDAAAALYRETGQSAYDGANRGAQSATTTVQKRLGKTLLSIRVVK